MSAARKQKPAALELAKAKLASSGLTLADADKLGIEILDASETAKLHKSFLVLPALRINYYDPRQAGAKLSSHPKWPPFYRIRYLREAGDAKDDIRYTNEPEAGVCAYFPATIDWSQTLPDHNASLIVTEGELKAAKACSEGFPTIGLGGVWNFRSSKLGITFLQELEAVNWVRRRVYIVFDSDVSTKPGVQQALNVFAEELAMRGALPFVVFVPEGEGGGKQGLDDWCVANPAGSVLDLLARHQPLTSVRQLYKYNERFCYVLGNGMVVNQYTNKKLTGAGFKEAYNNTDYAENEINAKGDISLEKAELATAWLRWPLRTQVNDITYRPGDEKLINYDSVNTSAINLWTGWGCEPNEGSIEPFMNLMDHLFAGSDPEDLKWFLQWCAYPIQYPGTKLYSSAVMWGARHGTGKSFIGYTLGRIYGENFVEINQSHLHGGFNAWAECKQFVMGDDVTGSNKRADNDLLKKMITQKTLRVNAKYMPEYEVPDCVNYYFTSNHPDAFFLEDDDRRFFIHEVKVGALDDGFYTDYELWLETGGAEAIFDFLLRLDTSSFNPAAPARKTAAKESMMADTRSDVAEWVHKLREDPDSVLKLDSAVIRGDLFSSAELLRIYDPTGNGRVTSNGLSREMRRAMIPLVNGDKPVRGPEGPARYYILRNVDHWLTASVKEIHEQLNAQRKGVVAEITKGKRY